MNSNGTAEQPYWAKLEGIAPIRAEYIVSHWNEEDTGVNKKRPLDEDVESEQQQEHSSKKSRNRGQNKAKERQTGRSRDHDELNLCVCIARGGNKARCNKPTCKFTHELGPYLATKKPDIPLKQCPFFSTFGLCPYGYRCRLLLSHVKNNSRDHQEQSTEDDNKLELDFDISKCKAVLSKLDPEQTSKIASESYEELATRVSDYKGQYNVIRPEAQKNVRKMDYILSNEYLVSIGESIGPKDSTNKNGKKQQQQKEQVLAVQEEDEFEDDGSTPAVLADDKAENGNITNTTLPTTAATEEDSSVNDRRTSLPGDVAPRIEKKRLEFSNKLYLAPLTTVGNLPFRRLCSTYGSDIHCSEMAMANELLSGSPTEWSLVRRHPCENIFGIQICGSRPQVLVPTAEALMKTCGNSIDFLDLNMGCPIDLVFKKGAGSALMEHSGRLAKSIIGMSKVLGEIPLTIKMRTGVREGNLLAHKLAIRAQHEWGLGALTIHGRTRQQRYTKSADYDYIKQCVQQVRAAQEEQDLTPIPIFGNGDAYDYRTYWDNVEKTGVDGIMIARGALIKPWIFTEIKERRDWDISSRERLDSIGKMCDYGLEHWGSDTLGVNTTRRFVCEALSFQHRYIPVGLLERLPTRMNDRPYPYKGRDDMETLLASPNAADWVKISSMFLGPPPDSWKFTPKHKSNAYDKEDMNG